MVSLQVEEGGGGLRPNVRTHHPRLSFLKREVQRKGNERNNRGSRNKTRVRPKKEKWRTVEMRHPSAHRNLGTDPEIFRNAGRAPGRKKNDHIKLFKTLGKGKKRIV